jgi:hypothetical protein
LSLDIVNGYLCLNCADVALAKQGINPAKPQDNPQSPLYNPAQAKADHGPAFQLSGALSANGATGVPGAVSASGSPTGAPGSTPPLPGSFASLPSSTQASATTALDITV